jgi:hypothetical protein
LGPVISSPPELGERMFYAEPFDSG